MPEDFTHNIVSSLRLRPIVHSDLSALYDFQCDSESNTMAGTKARTREAYFAAWERNLADPGINSRVIELDGPHGPTIVGSISRFQADGHDAVGYWIGRQFWGKGIASRAVELFLAEETRRPLRATAATSNKASRRILEGCGFRCLSVHMGEETDRFLAREIADYVLEAPDDAATVHDLTH
jgi:RimJ/RimL family protein N-acetyltransferase